ncbi:hypothetical protein M9H77_13118 [Catharanthus roseus]|uniref:Uncharacterized protein n=1 Tax=Catharanthus roseus TaxID=4058 RepID=A0ACC0BJ95_CATRO|nr:hypothetical protein M9H77_13118 [Catharanthus roseus]
MAILNLSGDQVMGLASRSLEEKVVAWIPVEGKTETAAPLHLAASNIELVFFPNRGRCPLRLPQGHCPLTPLTDRSTRPSFSSPCFAPGNPLVVFGIRQRLWRQAHGDEDIPKLTFDFHKAQENKLSGIVLKQEKMLCVLENPIPNKPANNTPRVEKDAYSKHKDDSNDVTCLMLATIKFECKGNSRKLKLMR